MNKKSELQKTMFGSTLWNIWIWLTIVLVVLADVNVVVSLGIEGVGGGHLAIPIIFLTLDVILALVAAFSNFRFRYSLVFPIIYAAFTVVMGVVGIVVYCAVLDYIVFTSFALISWMIFELLSVATILLSTIRASGKGLVFSIITVVLVVIFAAYSIFYVVMVARDGFFGQGKSGSYSSEERTTTYKYDEETDTYIATGTLSGRGGTVLVADSVNGKKVGEVDCSIFLGDGITSARLLCDGDVKFSNTECIADLSADFTVTALKDNIDDFKTYFYELSLETAEGVVSTYDARTDALRDAYADFANRITPEVEDGEVYIVFTYGYSDLQTLGVGNVLPTWISESGDKFEMSEFLKNIEVEDTFMYENMDPSKEDNLYYYYTNYGKIILNELQDPDGNPIEGRGITAPMSVGVSYEDIYAVLISTNDTVYEGTEEFSAISDFSSSGFRYVTGSSANDLITNINNTANARAGFTYKWTYGDGKNLSSLESVIEDGMEISLEWTLDAPTVSLDSSVSGIYGDVITLTPTVSHEDTSTISYSYSWTSTAGNAGSAKDYTFQKALPSDSGTYTLTVTASPEDTSLTSSASASVSVSISKKTLSFAWALDGVAIGILTDDERTYSGVYKTLSSTASGVLDDDTTFSYTQSITQVKDAGTYSFYATLDGDWGDYYALDSSASSSLTVSPYTLEVEWIEEAFTYDLESHVLSYSYTLDTLGEDSIDDTLLGASAAASAKVNAGTYTAEIVWTNGNYTISNYTRDFTISPAELTVTEWSTDSLTYCGDYQHPDISTFSGRVEGDEDDITFDYEYSGRNVGTGYTVTAKSLNSNYVIAEGSDSYTYAITAFELMVVWDTETTLTYDGSEQIISHYFADGNGDAIMSLGTDTINDGLLGVNVSGGETNAGSGYTATLTWDNDNYTITSASLSQTYSIAKRILIADEWYDEVYSDNVYVYDGNAHHPNVRLANIVDGDEIEINYSISGTTYSGVSNTEGKDAGTYTVTISISEINYELAEEYTCSYTVAKRQLTVSEWGNATHEYDGNAYHPDATLANIVDGETVQITYSINGTDYAGNTETEGKNVGSYTVSISINENNYELAWAYSCSFEITPFELTVSWVDAESLDLVYDGQIHDSAITYTVTGLGNDNLGASISFAKGDDENAEVKNAGDYVATVSITNGNYTLADETFSFSVAKRTLTVSGWYDNEYTYSDGAYVYDGNAHHPNATLVTIVDGETVQITYAVSGTDYSGNSNTEGKDAGTYIVTISIDEDNYELAETYTFEYTITKRQLTVSEWGDTTHEYDGSVYYPEATLANLVENETVQITYTISGTDYAGNADSEGKNVGSYAVSISINENNYQLTETTTCDYSITPITLTVTWNDGDAELTYNGSSQHPEAEFGKVLMGESVGEVEYEVTVVTAGDENSTIVGTYTVTVKSISNGNYALPAENDSSLSFDYTITPITVEVSWSDDDKELTYTGSAQHPEASFGNVLTGESVGNVVYTIEVTEAGDNDSTIVGKYTVTVSSISNANYALPEDLSVSFDYEIIPITLEVSWAPDSFTYTGSQQYPTATVTGVLNMDDANISYSIVETDGINVGEYTVTMVIGNSNYTAAEEDLTKTFIITEAKISVSAWDDTSLTYSGSVQYPTVTAFSGVFGEDDVQASYTVTTGNGTDAGEHVVTVSIGNTNYTLTGDATCTYDIAPITLTISWNEDTYTYNGTLQYPTATVSGVLTGEDAAVSYTVSAGNGIDAGSHTVQIVVGNTNYTVAENDLTKDFSISTATLTISNWDNTALIYTGSMQYPEATFHEVFSQDDTPDDLQTTYTVTTGDGINAGSHTVTVTVGNGNYTLTGTTSYTYTIGQKTLTIVWDESALTYNGEQQHPDATITGEVIEREADISYSVSNGDGINVGTTYTVTMTIGNPNYTAADNDLTTTFTITAANVSVSAWDETPLTYIGSVQYPTVTAFSGVFGSDELNPSYSVTEGNGKDAGTYTVTVTINNSNYVLTGDATHEYTISQKTLTISWSNENLIYTGSSQHPTVTIYGEITSGDANISYSMSDDGVDAGEHTVTLVISNTNYTASNLEYTYTIAKASVGVSWTNATPSFTWSGGSIDATTAGITCTYEVYDEENGEWQSTTEDAITAAGTYRATLTIAEDGNYEFASDAVTEQTFTVNGD